MVDTLNGLICVLKHRSTPPFEGNEIRFGLGNGALSISSAAETEIPAVIVDKGTETCPVKALYAIP